MKPSFPQRIPATTSTYPWLNQLTATALGSVVWLTVAATGFGATSDQITTNASGKAESRAAELKKLSIEELMTVEVATVTTASKTPEKATDAPATVLVITANDIKLRGYSMLTDVLRDLPGMETIPNYFSEFGTQVPVRGIVGNNKIIVLINGMRVNPPGGENFPFRSDFSVRDAEQIEIIYGPGSTLYGQDAISCVINVKTKQAPDHLSAELGAAGGWNFEREAWGTFGGMLDKDHDVSLTGYIQYHDSELTQLDKEYPKYWQAYENLARSITNANGKGVSPSREDFGLNIFARLEGYNSSLQVWHRQSERSSSEGFNAGLGFLPEARWGDMSTVVEGRNTLVISDKLKLESAATYNRYEIDPDTRYVFPVSSGGATVWNLNDYKYGLGWSAGLEETLRLEVSEKLKFIGGFDITYADIIPKASFPGGVDLSRDIVGQGGFFAYSTTPGGPLTLIPQVTEVSYWTYAGYVEGNWQMLDRLKLIAGTRVTKDDRFTDIQVTPRAALIYDVNDQWTAKYIYTRAYVAPAPYFADATFDNGKLLATTNPNIDPEKAQTHELNLTYNRKNLSLGASGYYGTQEEIITVADRGAPQNIVLNPVYLNGDPTQPRTLVHTANGGDSHRIGADLYARATFGPVSPWASYSYVDFQEKNAGVTTGLAGISRHNGRAGATWAVTSRLFVTPSLTIRSTPDNVNAGALKTELGTPYEINLFILYNVTKYLDVFTNIYNITDNKNALGGFTGDAIPQETIHGVFGVRLTF